MCMWVPFVFRYHLLGITLRVNLCKFRLGRLWGPEAVVSVGLDPQAERFCSIEVSGPRSASVGVIRGIQVFVAMGGDQVIVESLAVGPLQCNCTIGMSRIPPI